MHNVENGDELASPGQATQTQQNDAFHQLVTKLGSTIAQSSGFDFTDIDPRPIISLMEDYESKSCDWLRYAHRNDRQCFTRNLVDRGNGKYNLVSKPCWKEA